MLLHLLLFTFRTSTGKSTSSAKQNGRILRVSKSGQLLSDLRRGILVYQSLYEQAACKTGYFGSRCYNPRQVILLKPRVTCHIPVTFVPSRLTTKPEAHIDTLLTLRHVCACCFCVEAVFSPSNIFLLTPLALSMDSIPFTNTCRARATDVSPSPQS